MRRNVTLKNVTSCSRIEYCNTRARASQQVANNSPKPQYGRESGKKKPSQTSYIVERRMIRSDRHCPRSSSKAKKTNPARHALNDLPGWQVLGRNNKEKKLKITSPRHTNAGDVRAGMCARGCMLLHTKIGWMSAPARLYAGQKHT